MTAPLSRVAVPQGAARSLGAAGSQAPPNRSRCTQNFLILARSALWVGLSLPRECFGLRRFLPMKWASSHPECGSYEADVLNARRSGARRWRVRFQPPGVGLMNMWLDPAHPLARRVARIRARASVPAPAESPEGGDR